MTPDRPSPDPDAPDPDAPGADAPGADRLVVAIDGPSGSGKSTVARALAERLGYRYLDTGAMYRAVTWYFLRHGTDDPPADDEARRLLARMRLALPAPGAVEVDGEDVSVHLRSREVESRVSVVSAMPAVRAAMRALQRGIAAAGPIVAEGRDMGSVVFPRARWKFYLDAAPEERARRRYRDFQDRGRDVSEAQVLEEIQVRDHLDSTRRDAPLTRLADADYLDTTQVTTDAVIDVLIDRIQRNPSD